MILGKIIEELCVLATDEITLIAPFIKCNVVERLFSKISEQVKITCITRWRIEEILSGVSDIEIWPIINRRSNTRLLLRNNLHAKYYRIDKKCLIGSANLTASALGWSKNPNLELLISQSSEEASLKSFEKELLDSCIQVDKNLYNDIKTVVDNLRQDYQRQAYRVDESIEEISLETQDSIDYWIPTLRNPNDLYTFYTGQDKILTTQSRICAKDDLLVLQLPIGMSKDSFKLYVGIRLLQMPIIHKVDEFVSEPRRFGSIRDLLSSLPCSRRADFNANIVWQTLMRWLLFFLPERYSYSVPKHSEIFTKVQKINKR